MATILIVEDDMVLADMYEMVLRRAGYAVHKVVNGVDALYEASAVQPDLIVLDLMMPWASGDAVLGFIRSTDNLKKTQVLVVSAHPDGAKIAGQLDADGFLQKPVDMKVFTNHIDDMVAVSVLSSRNGNGASSLN